MNAKPIALDAYLARTAAIRAKLERLQQLADDDMGLDGTGYTDDALEALLTLNAGPADLDALADEYGEPRDDDHHVSVRLSLEPITASRWDEHRRGWDTDTEALEALLDR